MSDSTRPGASRVAGALLSLIAGVGLVAAAVVIPARSFSDLGDPERVAPVVRSFQITWLSTAVVLSLLYSAGLALLSRGRRETREEPDLGLPSRALGALLLLAAGFWLFVGAALARLAPAVVTSVPVVWALVLVVFLGTALWGRPLRSLGIAISVAGVLLGGWTIAVSAAIVDGGSPAVLVNWLWERVSESGGGASSLREDINFLSMGTAGSPLMSAAFLLLGLPLAILPRGGRGLTAPKGALAVAMLLLVSSLLLAETMRVVVLAQDTEHPDLSASILSGTWPSR